MQVQVVENVLKLNDEIAAMNRRDLKSAGIFAIDIIGAPGCGKTALIEATLQRLKSAPNSALKPDPRTLNPNPRVGVIVGDLATQRDADRMARHCDQVVQINTGKGCHLEAHHVRQAMGKMDLSKIDLLLIENVGNLICPVGFDLGQDAKVGVFAVSDGDDKAAKHPFIVCASSVLLLTKTDLLPHIPFDMKLFRDDIHQLNPTVQLIECSVTTNQGLDDWTTWLKQNCARAATAAR